MTQLSLFDLLPSSSAVAGNGTWNSTVGGRPAGDRAQQPMAGRKATAGAVVPGQPQPLGLLAQVVLARYEMYARRKAALQAGGRA
jgi:hypothetical protein